MEKQNKLKDSLLRFLRDLFDLTILNWLWLLCCLPVFTLGSATCGLYTVTLKMAREEPVSPVKDFFRGFRENFKPGLLLGLAVVLLAVVSAGDVWFALNISGGLHTLYLVIAMLMGVICLILLSFSFALQAMFDNPLKTQLVNAFKLAVVAPGKTVLLWLILLLPVLAALLLPVVIVQALGFLYVVLGISGPVYGASFLLRTIFDKVNGSPVVAQPPTTEE